MSACKFCGSEIKSGEFCGCDTACSVREMNDIILGPLSCKKACIACGKDATGSPSFPPFCKSCFAAGEHHGKFTDPSPDTKPDATKPMAATPYEYFPRAIMMVAQVATFGAPKYGRGTWASLPNGHQRRTDAFHRHLLAHAAGQKCDPESGLPHLAHALWNLMSMVEWEAREAEKKF